MIQQTLAGRASLRICESEEAYRFESSEHSDLFVFFVCEADDRHDELPDDVAEVNGYYNSIIMDMMKDPNIFIKKSGRILLVLG